MSKNRPTWPVSLARGSNCPSPDQVKIAATKSSRTGTVGGDVIDLSRHVTKIVGSTLYVARDRSWYGRDDPAHPSGGRILCICTSNDASS